MFMLLFILHVNHDSDFQIIAENTLEIQHKEIVLLNGVGSVLRFNFDTCNLSLFALIKCDFFVMFLVLK